MVESLKLSKQKKYPYSYTTKQQRASAAEIPKRNLKLSKSHVLKYLTTNIETLFVTKKVYTADDWLNDGRELG